MWWWVVILSLLGFFISCNTADSIHDIEKWKDEIMQVEQDFNDLAQKVGLPDAFYVYAAHDGVIRKSGKLFEGKTAIKQRIESGVRPNETLTWMPTFIDVSRSGDLAYTYGDATFTVIDSLGNKKERTSVYHTVWKRQADGNWRFVWD